MKTQTYLLSAFLFLLTFISCKQNESKPPIQPKMDIHLPTNSAKVIVHIKDNKVASYEIVHEDGSPINEPLVYRQVGVDGEKICYSCPPGKTETKDCDVIKCPKKDHCKEIYCGPLRFDMYDNSSSTGKATEFSIIADGVK